MRHRSRATLGPIVQALLAVGLSTLVASAQQPATTPAAPAATAPLHAPSAKAKDATADASADQPPAAQTPNASSDATSTGVANPDPAPPETSSAKPSGDAAATQAAASTTPTENPATQSPATQSPATRPHPGRLRFAPDQPQRPLTPDHDSDKPAPADASTPTPAANTLVATPSPAAPQQTAPVTPDSATPPATADAPAAQATTPAADATRQRHNRPHPPHHRLRRTPRHSSRSLQQRRLPTQPRPTTPAATDTTAPAPDAAQPSAPPAPAASQDQAPAAPSTSAPTDNQAVNPSMPAPQVNEPEPPPGSRIDIFGGYTYLRPSGSVGTFSFPTNNTRGYIASGTYYFHNSGFGVQAEFSHSEYPLGTTGTSPAPPFVQLGGVTDSFYTVEAGPVYRFFVGQHVIPFVHFIGGGAKVAGPKFQPPTWGYGFSGGGGVDVLLPHTRDHVAFRLVQADFGYMHADQGALQHYDLAGGTEDVSTLRISTGLVFRFGEKNPVPAKSLACDATPSEVYAGERVTVAATLRNYRDKTKHPFFFAWQLTAGKQQGFGPVIFVDTTGLAGGTYHATAHISLKEKGKQFAQCSTNFVVKESPAPTVKCSADPSTVTPGQVSIITAYASTIAQRQLTYSYTTSEGQINGKDNTAELHTDGLPPGVATVTCNVQDDLGRTAVGDDGGHHCSARAAARAEGPAAVHGLLQPRHAPPRPCGQRRPRLPGRHRSHHGAPAGCPTGPGGRTLRQRSRRAVDSCRALHEHPRVSRQREGHRSVARRRPHQHHAGPPGADVPAGAGRRLRPAD